jgi:surfeit locus 1 family protein
VLVLLRPRFWLGHLAMVLCVAIAVGLGLWQLDAWRQHRAAAERDLVNEPAKPLDRVMSGDGAFPGDAVGQPVTFSGHWIDGNLYVADRELDGRRGYWVLTALAVDESGSAMPVVRGWVPRPDAPTPTGQATVTGWLQASDGSDDVDDDPHDDVLPSVRVGSVVEHVDADLYSGYVVAKKISGGQQVPYVRPQAIPDVSGTTALRNFLYALEWWVFGGFAVFIWVRWCRDQLEERDVTEVSAPDAPAY